MGLAGTRVTRWLRRPAATSTVVAVVVATIVSFVIACILFARPYSGDSFEFLPSSWAISRGQWTCAYPATAWNTPQQLVSTHLAAPLFSLVIALLLSLWHFSSAIAFPTLSAMGPHCTHALALTEQWIARANVATASLWIGVVGWLALLGAVLYYLARTPRGITHAALAAFVAATCGATIFWTFGFNYHPQDLFAVALVVVAITSASRQRWLTAGVFVGLGLLTQQFVILAAIPLVVVAWHHRRWRLIAGAALSYAVIAGPLLWLTSGRTWPTLVSGSSRIKFLSSARFHSSGGTWLAGLHLYGTALFAVARAAPILVSLILSVLAVRQDSRSRLLELGPLTALVGLGLSMRLVFEQNLFPYYFAPMAVMLILAVNAMAARSDLVVTWLWFTTIGFSPLFDTFMRAPINPTRTLISTSTWLFLAIPVIVIVVNLFRRHLVLYQPLALIVALVMFHAPMTGLGVHASLWASQLVLTSLGLYVLGSALFSALAERSLDPQTSVELADSRERAR